MRDRKLNLKDQSLGAFAITDGSSTSLLSQLGM
jgi:hypothetical protein